MTIKHDFTNPIVSCAIVSKDGSERVPLWTNTQINLSGEATLLRDNTLSLAVVQELIVELDLGYIPVLTATLVLPQAEAIAFLNSNVIVWGRSRLVCQIGYAMGDEVFLSDPYEGILMEPDIQTGVQTTINLVGQGTKGFDATRRGKGTQLQGTREAVIRTILLGPDQDNPRGVPVDFSEVEAVPDSLAFKLMFEEKITLAAGWVTDWHIVMRLVKEARCYMFYEGVELRIFPIDTRFTAKPKFKFSLFPPPSLVTNADGESFAGIGPASKVYPILNFSSPSKGVYFPNIVRGMVIKGVKDDTGEPYTEVVNSDSDNEGGEAEARVGNEDAGVPEGDDDHPKGDDKTGDGLDPHHADQPTDTEKDRARAEVKAGNTLIGVQVEIESLGVPEILPGDVFRLEGLGIRWDQNYAVQQVTHRLGTGGYSTHVVGVNDTGIITDAVQAIEGNVGNEEPETESDDSTTAQPSAG